MWHHVERLAGSLMLAGVLWLAWITPDELLALLPAAGWHPAVWLGAGVMALLPPVLVWRVLRRRTRRLPVARRAAASPGRLRA